MAETYLKQIDNIWQRFIRNASTRTQLRQGQVTWSEDGKIHQIHNPSHERLIADGWYRLVDMVYDSEKRKLVPDSYTLDGETISQDTIALTQEEFDARVQAKRAGLTCSLLQLKKALNLTGKRGPVMAALNTADQDTKDAFDCASVVKRLDPMFISFGVDVLGMTEIEMDDFIIMARTL